MQNHFIGKSYDTIIAPEKYGVNPPAGFYHKFYTGFFRRRNTPQKQSAPAVLAVHGRGALFRILPWCEEESCTRERLRPRFLMWVV